MKLPKAEAAVVPESKITEYLLSTTHRDGRHKAAFFIACGFVAEEWQTLANALLKHASENVVARAEATPFGTRYVVEGRILTPTGRAPNVRVVWFLENGQDAPRLVTAYPLEATGDD